MPVVVAVDAISRQADSRALRFADGVVRIVLSVSVDSIASLLGVAARSLYRWIANGDFPAAVAVEDATRRPRYTIAEVAVYAQLVEARVLAHRHVDARRLFDEGISPSGDLYSARVAITRRLLGVQ